MSEMSALRPPSIITKQLSFNVVEGKRKARLSSNFLALMDFKQDMPICATSLGDGAGFVIEPAPAGTDSTHKVYSRGYNRTGRSNNPLELVVEFGGQSFIDQCFSRVTERFHVEMRPGKVRFTPIANRVFNIINRFKKQSPLNVLVALTGAVDVHAMEQLGWKAEVILEHRPMEKRDAASGRNLSEVHALNTWVNGSPRVILNEDIHQLELHRLAAILEEIPPIGICHYSLGCDSHSSASNKKAKVRAIDDLSTMIDMVYPCLTQIQQVQPMIAMVENVRGFKDDAAGKMLVTTLRRFGYHVTEMVLSGLDYGAQQARERYYMVASVFPGYEAPKPIPRSGNLIWPVIERHLPNCQDVTETGLIKSREGYWRNLPPYLTRESTFCPTIMKSQDRVRDGVFIEDGGRIYKPSIALLKELMSIPANFNVEWLAKEQATETLGQSVDYVLHQAVIKSINSHLKVNVGSHSLVKYGLTARHG